MESCDLLDHVARNDERAFSRLYERFADRIFRYALTLLRNHHLAEEVVQETMIAIWKNAESFGGRSQVSTWIFGIARNQAYTLLRREVAGERRSVEKLFLPDPAEEVEREEQVRAAMSTLPVGQREVVFLAFYEGLSYGEIARILAVPEGTVKSRMYHAKQKLAGALT